MLTFNDNSNCSANFIVISLVPVLFFVSMLLGYLNILPIHVPVHALVIIGFILFIFLLFIKHNANYTICKMRASYFKMEQELRIKLEANSLKINDEYRSVLDMQKFLNEYYSGIRNDNFVSVASSIFPMLGILGTFLAIAVSMPNFSVTDTQALDNEISILLSGVGSAFFASIYGILLSLIWTYFEKRGLSKVDIYFSRIKKSFKTNIWSPEELLIYKYSKYAEEDNKFISALKETFNLDFIKTVNKEHLENFRKIMHETNYNFTQISTHLQYVSDELKETLALVDNSKNAIEAKNQIESSLVEFTHATKSFERTSKLFSAQLDSSLNNTFKKIDTQVGDIVIKLADFATHVSLESKEVQNSIKSYHDMIASQVKVK
ncbi:MotA/TolQ/ExbB proton channel family protein [bacterium]|nr:MotA/TolQ/ExbB proton channel family protein [bacterium]MBU1989837.1 MotA/TolQ/ExbB proton channel family protein [bacterium]